MRDARDIHSITHAFQPNRLTLARDRQLMTKSELAERVGKTPSAISQFESGRIKPDHATVLRLGMALGVPPGYFAYESPAAFIPVESCHFRSLRSTRQRERRKVLANATHLGDLVLLLESNYVDLPQEQVSQLATAVTTPQDIEQCAADVRRRWDLGLGPIGNMVNLLESRGIVVCPIEEESTRVDAFSFWRGDRPFVLLVTAKKSSSRARFDAAHELGHLVMHADALPGDPAAERQADRFASAFLLPYESFYPECPRTLNWAHFRELKDRWKVSLAALVRRARDIGRISEHSYKRAYMQLNQKGWRQNEPNEPPPEHPQIITQSIRVAADEVDLDTLAGDAGMTTPMLTDMIRLLGGTHGASGRA